MNGLLLTFDIQTPIIIVYVTYTFCLFVCLFAFVIHAKYKDHLDI